MDLNDIPEFLLSAARSVGAEITSPWFYLQLGLILAGAGIAYAVMDMRRNCGATASRSTAMMTATTNLI